MNAGSVTPITVRNIKWMKKHFIFWLAPKGFKTKKNCVTFDPEFGNGHGSLQNSEDIQTWKQNLKYIEKLTLAILEASHRINDAIIRP